VHVLWEPKLFNRPISLHLCSPTVKRGTRKLLRKEAGFDEWHDSKQEDYI